MMTIAQYAESRGVSQTAIRRQLSRYEKELTGHVTIQDRKKFLDPEAVAFLDKHRMARTIIQENAEGKAKQEIETLKAEIDLLRQKVLEDKEHIIKLLEENRELIPYKVQSQLLLEQKSSDQEQLQSLSDSLQETKNRLQEVEQEVNSFKKSWFGFYRKK